MSSLLWDGKDGERPAASLDLADLERLLEATDAFVEDAGAGRIGAIELQLWQELRAFLVRWQRAEAEWWASASESDPMAETPF
jgi:hypothetical protein